MDIVIAGGHGQIALHLARLLSEHGDRVIGMIRNPDHVPDLEQAGGEPVLTDLEKMSAAEIAEAIGTADALVFAAGAGPGSGPERKRTVDLDGAVKTIDAAKRNGIARYVMVSAMGADSPPEGDDGMAPYLRAKAEADEALRASGLDFTIVRPGRLTDDEPTGRVQVAEHTGRSEVSRADVASVLHAVLNEAGTIGATLEVVSGEDAIEDAVRAAASQG